MKFAGGWSDFKVRGQNTFLQMVPVLTLGRTGPSEASRQTPQNSHDVFRFRFRFRRRIHIYIQPR